MRINYLYIVREDGTVAPDNIPFGVIDKRYAGDPTFYLALPSGETDWFAVSSLPLVFSSNQTDRQFVKNVDGTLDLLTGISFTTETLLKMNPTAIGDTGKFVSLQENSLEKFGVNGKGELTTPNTLTKSVIMVDVAGVATVNIDDCSVFYQPAVATNFTINATGAQNVGRLLTFVFPCGVLTKTITLGTGFNVYNVVLTANKTSVLTVISDGTKFVQHSLFTEP